MRESEVSKHVGVGVRMIYLCAVVSEGVFKTYFGCVPSDLDMKVVSVLGIDGKPFNAVIMTFVEPWPVNLPHFKMELYCDQSRDWKDVLLTPDWNLRKGQAKDRFTLACKHLEEKTDKSLHMKALPEMTTLAHVDQRAKKLQQAREKAEEDDNDDFEDVKLMPATIISASNRNEDDDDSNDDGRAAAAASRIKRKAGTKSAGTPSKPRRPLASTKSPATPAHYPSIPQTPDSSRKGPTRSLPTGSDDGMPGTAAGGGSVLGMDEVDDYRSISFEQVIQEQVKPGYMMRTAISLPPENRNLG